MLRPSLPGLSDLVLYGLALADMESQNHSAQIKQNAHRQTSQLHKRSPE